MSANYNQVQIQEEFTHENSFMSKFSYFLPMTISSCVENGQELRMMQSSRKENAQNLYMIKSTCRENSTFLYKFKVLTECSGGYQSPPFVIHSSSFMTQENGYTKF